jgi:DNA-directed RNA polymerase specialized sigma24 family protein
MPHSSPSVSHLLQELRAGNKSAFNDLLPQVYDELHRLASKQRNRWDGDETLNTTALVHEAYFRLADQSAPNKRGGRSPHVPLHEIEAALLEPGPSADVRDDILVALDDALHRLEQVNHRQMRIVECRFFGGMSVDDTAEALNVSPATVKRGWSMAQAWLYRDLKARAAEGS